MNKLKSLIKYIRAIKGGYFQAARRAEKKASGLERQLIKDIENFKS